MSKYDALWDYAQRQEKADFAEIEEIAGVPIEHSFLRYQKEPENHGWQVGKISMKGQTVRFRRK